MEWHKEAFTISTDKQIIDVKYVHEFLCNQSYWSAGIPLKTVEQSIAGALCFSVFHGHAQIGFARVITDGATFGYLADVFIDERYRGRGLSKWLIEIILAYPGLQGLRRFLLATKDAHSLYAQHGFTALTSPERWMQIHNPDVYMKKIS